MTKNNILNWWKKSSESKKHELEMEVFGQGEFGEDNSLHDNDIITIFNYQKNKIK